MGTIERMRNLQFDDMHLFARVAELGKLPAGTRERDVAASQVSHSASRLAAWFRKCP